MGCLNSKATAEKTKSTDKHPTAKKVNDKGQQNAGGKGSAAKTGAAGNKSAAAAMKPAADDKPTPTAAADPSSSTQNVAETFLRTVLERAEHFFSTLPDSQSVKQVVALTFMNSCVEVTRNKYRMKTDALIELARSLTHQLKLPLLQASLAQVEERSVDDSFSRILVAWHGNNASLTKQIPAEAAQAVLDTLYIRYTSNKQASFEDILVYQIRWVTVNQAAMEVFAKFSEGKDSMSKEQVGRFLRETQGIEITDRQLTEKFKYRFGGGIHRYNFASYSGSVLTNNAIDPSRTSDVYQDMTQSFTRYLVQCTRIETEEDLSRALIDNSRAYILNIKKDGGKFLSGSCPLQAIVEAIKKTGFATDTYPIVLCLSPGKAIPVALQTEVAALLAEMLGPHLAKGLMFEGAVISDPKFSPGALRKKVLIMGPQCNLRPFVGFMVSDMNKDGLGVRVTDVVEGTPASKAGVLKDDWLTHINQEPIRNKDHLRECLAKVKVGEEFSVKRENLDEIKVVVGGVVDPSDTSVSAELSAITFFCCAPAGEGQYKPWDVEVVSEASLAKLAGDPKHFASHFGLISTNDAPSDTAQQSGSAAAPHGGVQFIDHGNSEQSLAWCRGRFYENGRCGYLLKTDMDLDRSSDLSLTVIGGPRLIGCASLSSAAVRIHGSGSAQVAGTLITFTGCDEATVAVVQLTFEQAGGQRVFTAAFCPSLIRPGYRAMPCVLQGEERKQRKLIHGTYLFAKRS